MRLAGYLGARIIFEPLLSGVCGLDFEIAQQHIFASPGLGETALDVLQTFKITISDIPFNKMQSCSVDNRPLNASRLSTFQETENSHNIARENAHCVHSFQSTLCASVRNRQSVILSQMVPCIFVSTSFVSPQHCPLLVSSSVPFNVACMSTCLVCSMSVKPAQCAILIKFMRSLSHLLHLVRQSAE